MVGMVVGLKVIANSVVEPVERKTQRPKAKLDNAEPTLDTNCPAQTSRKDRAAISRFIYTTTSAYPTIWAHAAC
jgi:hypothetical protein